METAATHFYQADILATVLAPPVAAPGQLTELGQVIQFVLGGNATFTLVSKTTGARFTFKVQKHPDSTLTHLHFVKLLRGQDNEADFQFFGTIFHGRTFKHSAKSRIGTDAPSAVAFRWFWRMLMDRVQIGREMSSSVEVWHEGKCGRCGRKLTVPSSVASGFGPECAGKIS